jgi:4-phytase/acid phosphatase
VLIVVGHDTNLSNLSGLLNLSWKLPGYPADDTPPGGALIFSLWNDSLNNRRLVRLRYAAQTPDQMRNAEPLTFAAPPAMQELDVPGCAPARDDCRLEQFTEIGWKAIDPSFID